MELANLSSNWKQLQKKLKASDPNPNSSSSTTTTTTTNAPLRSKPFKRKHDDLSEARQPGAPRKKVRRNERAGYSPQSHRAGKKMNGTATSSDRVNGEEPAAATAPQVLSSAELVNAGLSKDVELGKYLALDCEMVGIGPQPGASALARASLVTFHGTQLYDSYVLPTEVVTDWRTPISGICPSHMRHARPFAAVQRDVARLLKGRVLVGHSVRNDLEVLGLSHPRRDVRDTARYPPYRALAGGGSPRLKVLVGELLGVEIQGGEHSSVEDARATMMLFRRDRNGFERENVRRWGPDRREVVATQGEKGDEDADEEGGEGDEGAVKKKSKKKKKKKKK